MTAWAETLQIILHPSVVFHDALGDENNDLLFFSVVEPSPNSIGCGCQDQALLAASTTSTSLPSTSECESVCGYPCQRVCGATFSANFALYDSVQFINDNTAIRLRHPPGKPRFRAEFSASWLFGSTTRNSTKWSK